MDKRATIPPGLPRPNPTASYWQDPPDGIADFRSTEKLPECAEYVIVGSGISGACIAWNILQRQKDANVVMLEARRAASGATGRNGGHTKAASYRTFPEHCSTRGAAEAAKIARLEHANIRATHVFAAEHNISCESRPCDTTDVIYDDAAWSSGQHSIGLMRRELGPDDPASKYRIYGAEEARKQFLTPGKDVRGAFQYEAGSISAYKFAIGVLKLCLAQGLNLQTNTPVTSIPPVSTSTVIGHGGQARWTVHTPRGTVITTHLILATNGYTPHLLPTFQSKVVPLRGQVTVQRPGARLRTLAANGLPTTYSFIYPTGYEYMIPRPHLASIPTDLRGDIVIGGGIGMLPNEGLMEFGETDDEVLNAQNSEYLRECTGRYFGENWGADAPEGRVRKEWTGVMGITADGLPFVGEVPGMEGCWVCAGFNGHGMVLCLKSAEALTHMLFQDPGEDYAWFPDSFRITERRLKDAKFEGRKGMKAPAPPEKDLAKPSSQL